MIIQHVPRADVIRHFLRLEASQVKYSARSEEILSWCNLSDEQLLERARCFADERDDTNPALIYTIGITKDDRSSRIANWKRESIICAEIYTSDIASQMRQDINAVNGNLLEFALRFSAKYPEFAGNKPLPHGDAAVIIVIAQTKQSRKGMYELVDGAHRLVALCKGGVKTVEAYVGHLKTDE